MKLRYLTVSRTPSNALLELLNNNTIGTPGLSMLYQHMNVNDKLSKIERPYFVSLERAGDIAGTCCFCKRDTVTNAKEIASFYVRYFSFKDVFRKSAKSVRASNRTSTLRAEVNAMLAGAGLEIATGAKFFHYAYVDARNERSAVLCNEFGFEPVREYTTLLFSRLFPKRHASGKITEVNAESVQPLLEKFYHDFSMVSFENLADRKYYFIENEKGERIAGVQVNPDRWKIQSLPGILMNSIANIFSAVPILNRLVNRNFRFLTFENVYWKSGSEKSLELLFEHLLAKYGAYTAICVVDADSKVYHALKSLPLGLVNKMNKEVKGNVICRFENFSVSEKVDFKNSPAFISGIDAT